MAQWCHFTLDDGVSPNAVRTCGDPIRAHVHLRPTPGETLSISNLRVNFKCKVRTLISTGSGNNRRLHKSKVYLFNFSTVILGSRTISLNSEQSWPVSFDFPWEVLPHPTQYSFQPNPLFAGQPGHRLPPTWYQNCRGHDLSIQYYLEAVMTRQGRMIEHNDKRLLAFNFSPPLDVPDPSPDVRQGARQSIIRSSRLLDPEKRDEHYGFRERTKHLFSNETDPVAMFSVSASAPTICCAGDKLPVALHVNYDEARSTAPKPPELKLKSVHIRLTDLTRYRVSRATLIGDSDLERDSEAKINIANRALHPARVVYDGMALNDFMEIGIGQNLGCSFATYTVNRQYLLKISGIFDCAGKDFDMVLTRHHFTIHPNRILYRQLPGAPPGPPPPQAQPSMHPEDETLPPYVAGPSEPGAEPPSYDKSDEKK